jgi:rare lipoprotein A
MKRVALALVVFLLTGSGVAAAQTGTERGIASVYSTALVGHVTASGEVFDSGSFTAAHRHLPLGSVIEVTNKRNGRKVIVTVNDRGPHLKGRIIDLSPAAARRLGMGKGLAPVEIRVASRGAHAG